VRSPRPPAWLRLPPGLRDWPPEELARLRALEGRLRAAFETWGYREVATPALEYLETWQRGAGGPPSALFVVVDRTGELLALRPEMTVPVARFVATRWPSAVARLYYVGSVFRGGEVGRGDGREFLQAGVERVGDGGPDADAEVVALAVDALRHASVPEVRLGLGHAGFLRALLDAADLPEEDRGSLAAALLRRDFVTVSSRLAAAPPTVREALQDLPALRGPDALRRARQVGVGTDALDELESVWDALQAYGVGQAVEVDVGIVRDFDYYTGVVFEAYAPGVGAPVLGGGRYDGLLARFGDPRPAVGFAVHAERALAASTGVEVSGQMLDVYYDREVRALALRWAQAARAEGVRVAAGPASSTPKGPGVWFRADGTWWVQGGDARRLTPEELESLSRGGHPWAP
jgi:ATP phosphoribosyltransferase regulatory subunit